MPERHDDVAFEPRDVKVGPIFGSLSALAVSLAAAMLGLWWMQALFLRHTPERPPELPPPPRIEGVGLDYSVTNADLPNSARSQRLRENQMLRDGWTDAAGKKHLPIAEAMKRLVELEGRH
jgi:hypothetical protein